MERTLQKIDWQPSCDLAALLLRAKLLADTRHFFAERAVLEVETPLLASSTGTEPQMAFFETQFEFGSHQQTLFLQTSPEFAMKRLLAAGSGSIFQIAKAFRNGEVGRFHNPEFSLLEWYRVDFDLSQLMDEVAALFSCLFKTQRPQLQISRVSYEDIFYRYTGLDSLTFELPVYLDFARQAELIDAPRVCGDQHSVWLDYLFSERVQPKLGQQGLEMVYGYPACQASLARINAQDSRIADRVEVFMAGIELGNGFFELSDVNEQAQRFEVEMQLRQKMQQPIPTIDQKLLAALQNGLPKCAGIAIGLDRVLMLLSEKDQIEEVLAFSHRSI